MMNLKCYLYGVLVFLFMTPFMVLAQNLPSITLLSLTDVTQADYNLEACIKSDSRLINVSVFLNGNETYNEYGVNPVRNDGCDYSVNKNFVLKSGRNVIKVVATNFSGTKYEEFVVVYTSNSSNTNNNSNNNNRQHRFNSPKLYYPVVGLSFGYVAKQWENRQNGAVYKYGFWEDQKFINGGQIGIRVEPLFKFGFGLCTGLFYEYYYTHQSDGSNDFIFQEHNAYMPVHFEYRFHFSNNFSLFFYGGFGLDFGIYASLMEQDSYGNELGRNDNIYNKENEWSRFNYSYEYGVGMRIYIVQINFGISKGILDMSNHSEYTLKQNKNINASVTLMF